MGRENRNPTDHVVLAGAAYAVLLGSGLDSVTSGFSIEATLPFGEIEGLSPPAVPGHRGEIKRCMVAGRPCLFVCGRQHVYEGAANDIRVLIGHLHRLGVHSLVLTSAAGSLVKSVSPGELVLVSDVIDAQCFRSHEMRHRIAERQSAGSPEHGSAATGSVGGSPPPPPHCAIAAERARARGFLSLDSAMSRDLWVSASRGHIGLARGSAVVCAGPMYETPAEILALQQTGASVVTMSGAPEIESASAFGMRVAMVAVVTNWASGISSVRLRHEDVLEVAQGAVAALRQLIVEFMGTASA